LIHQKMKPAKKLVSRHFVTGWIADDVAGIEQLAFQY